jgi:hypothetical protein
MERTQVWRLMRDYCRRAGLPIGVGHPHALKHSCGRYVVQMETPIIVVQEMARPQEHAEHDDLCRRGRRDATSQQQAAEVGSQKPRKAA